MKSFFCLMVFCMALPVFAGTSSVRKSKTGVNVRYKTTYRNFDRSFNEQYRYRETNERCGRYYTCYTDYSDTTIVYVDEVVIRESGNAYYGHRRVIVYRDSDRYEPYVTYYIDPYGHVYARRWHYHPYYYDPYWHDPYYHHYVIVDFDTVAGKVLTAAYFWAVGLEMLARAEEPVDYFIAALFSWSGTATAISANEQAKDESELAARCKQNAETVPANANDVR